MATPAVELKTEATPSAPVAAAEPAPPVEKQDATAIVPETAPVEKKEEPVNEEKKADAPEPTIPPTEELQKLEISEKKPEAEPATEAAVPTPVVEEATKTKPTPAPAPVESTAAPGEPVWPETGPDHPLTKFYDSYEELTKEADHNEVYGITLAKDAPFHTKLILQKFLRANSNDLVKAKEQLLETLKWRKSFEPAKAAEESFDKEIFGGLGYILELENVPESTNKKDVVTFNVYGAVKDNKKTFGDLDGFLRWRVGLMERSVRKLNLGAATKPIPDFGEGPDPYQGFQVHDYLQVSFIRQDPHVKASSKKTIEVLGRYYPETLSRKFFVNVPMVMGWVFAAMKLFVSKETVKKFSVLSYGNQLAAELGQGIPKEYGGSAGDLKEVAEGMNLTQ